MNNDTDPDGTLGRAKAWESVARTLSNVMPNWHKIANTGERSAVAAIERLAEEANRSKEVEARERGLSMARISTLTTKLRAARNTLRQIGWEPLGIPDATPTQALDIAGELARKSYEATGGEE